MCIIMAQNSYHILTEKDKYYEVDPIQHFHYDAKLYS